MAAMPMDASSSVSPQLLYHFSAVSQYKYPPHQMLPTQVVVDLLLKAPQVAQQYPFAWTMLDAPPEGSVFLVWISPATTPATDGCVWLEQEHFFSGEEKGYILEMHHHKSGFAPGTDAVVHRSRRRYRLVTTPKTPPGAPQPDPNLWIFHYCRNDRSPHIPSASIPLPVSISNTLVTRRNLAQLQIQGVLPKKDFYLMNPQSWPVMNAPPNMQQPGQMMPPQHPQQMQQMQHAPSPRHMSPARPPPQQQYYPPQQQPGPPAKRYKQTPAQGPMPGPPPPHDAHAIDPEEDNSRGDILDHLSPREIATVRYTQHHEWMEEVLGSAYSISQIVPVDMGFGLQGTLKSLTDGLFEPPAFPASRPPPPTTKTTEKVTVGDKEFGDTPKEPTPLLPDLSSKVTALRSRVEAYLAETDNEIAALNAKHASNIARIRKSDAFTRRERDLRENFTAHMSALQSDDAALLASTETDLEAIAASIEAEFGQKISKEKKVFKWKVAEDDTPEMPPPGSAALASGPVFSAALAPPPPLSSAPLPPLPVTAEGGMPGVSGGEDVSMGEMGEEDSGEGEGFFADALMEGDVDMGGVQSDNGNGGV